MAIILSGAPAFVTRVLAGGYKNDHFIPNAFSLYDLGDSFYAPNTFFHPDGRQIQFAWLREQGDSLLRVAQGWQGVMSLPREVWIDDDIVRARPAKELALLRGAVLADIQERTLEHGQMLRLGNTQFAELDLRCETDAVLSLDLLSDSQSRQVRLHVDGPNGMLQIDFGALSGGVPRALFIPFHPDNQLHLQLFIDGTTLELFINEREFAASRAYPDSDCTSISLRAIVPLLLHSLRVFKMNPAYK